MSITERTLSNALLFVLLVLVFGSAMGACQRVAGPQTVADAQAILQAGIAAQGGVEALARLDNARIVSQCRFKGTIPARRTVDHRAPDTWAMTIDFNGAGVMRFGMAGDRCWRSERHLTSECAEHDRQEHARIAALLEARMLHRIDPNQVQPAATVPCAAGVCPAIRVGELVLAFDPSTHRLAAVHLENRVDTLSEYATLGGVTIATRRVLMIGDELDMDETWTEIVPGGADPNALRVPDLPRNGVIVVQDDSARLVAWTPVENPAADARAVIERLDAFIRARGRRVSHSDGVILVEPPRDGAGASQWRLAVGVEVGAGDVPIDEGDMHIERWPAGRIAGIFHQGDPLDSAAQRSALGQALNDRGLTAVSNARWQILFPRADLTRPVGDRLSFVQIAIR